MANAATPAKTAEQPYKKASRHSGDSEARNTRAVRRGPG